METFQQHETQIIQPRDSTEGDVMQSWLVTLPQNWSTRQQQMKSVKDVLCHHQLLKNNNNQLLVVEKVLFFILFVFLNVSPRIYQMSEATTLKQRLQIWISFFFLSFSLRITKRKGESEESVLERTLRLFLRFTGRPEFFRRKKTKRGDAAENPDGPEAHAESKHGTPEGGHTELWLQIFRDGGRILAKRWRGLERQRTAERLFIFQAKKAGAESGCQQCILFKDVCSTKFTEKAR